MTTPDPQAKVAAPGRLFRTQLMQLKAYAANDGQALLNADHSSWFTPVKEDWDGDPLSLSTLGSAFSRAQHEQEFDSAVADPNRPGTTGDLVVSQLQGDVLAAMERASRSRHRSSVRNKIHAAARRTGHGRDAGTINMVMLNYVERLIRWSNA